jgi:hypothetical protein
MQSCGPQGQCTDACTAADFCPTTDFCNLDAGTCYSNGNAWCVTGCQPCNPNDGLCLATLIEGQEALFCAVICSQQSDCPSGFICQGVIQDCCPAGNCTSGQSCSVVNAAGQTQSGVCQAWQVVDESALQFLCTDTGTDQPIVFQRACTPITGFCDSVSQP